MSIYNNLNFLIFKNKELKNEILEQNKIIDKLKIENQEFLYELAHEFKNSLAVIKICLDNLNNEKDKDKILCCCHNSIDELSLYLNTFLKLSKIDLENNNFKKECLSELFLDTVESLKIVLDCKKIELIFNIEEEIYFSCLKKDLVELIINLINNSVKYISNERKIFINLCKHKNKIFFSVRDTGIGISKKDLPFVFNKFFRIKTKIKTNGSGLGLYISKKIVEKYNGKIFIDSREGKWTEILVIF